MSASELPPLPPWVSQRPLPPTPQKAEIPLPTITERVGELSKDLKKLQRAQRADTKELYQSFTTSEKTIEGVKKSIKEHQKTITTIETDLQRLKESLKIQQNPKEVANLNDKINQLETQLATAKRHEKELTGLLNKQEFKEALALRNELFAKSLQIAESTESAQDKVVRFMNLYCNAQEMRKAIESSKDLTPTQKNQAQELIRESLFFIKGAVEQSIKVSEKQNTPGFFKGLLMTQEQKDSREEKMYKDVHVLRDFLNDVSDEIRLLTPRETVVVASQYLQDMKTPIFKPREAVFRPKKFFSRVLHTKVGSLAGQTNETATKLLLVQSDIEKRMNEISTNLSETRTESLTKDLDTYDQAITELESQLQEQKSELLERRSSSTKAEALGFISRWEAKAEELRAQIQALRTIRSDEYRELLTIKLQAQSALLEAKRNPRDAPFTIHRMLKKVSEDLPKVQLVTDPDTTTLPPFVQSVERMIDVEAKSFLVLSETEQRLVNEILEGKQNVNDCSQDQLQQLLAKGMVFQIHFGGSQPDHGLNRILAMLSDEKIKKLDLTDLLNEYDKKNDFQKNKPAYEAWNILAPKVTELQKLTAVLERPEIVSTALASLDGGHQTKKDRQELLTEALTLRIAIENQRTALMAMGANPVAQNVLRGCDSNIEEPSKILQKQLSQIPISPPSDERPPSQLELTRDLHTNIVNFGKAAETVKNLKTSLAQRTKALEEAKQLLSEIERTNHELQQNYNTSFIGLENLKETLAELEKTMTNAQPVETLKKEFEEALAKFKDQNAAVKSPLGPIQRHGVFHTHEWTDDRAIHFQKAHEALEKMKGQLPPAEVTQYQNQIQAILQQDFMELTSDKQGVSNKLLQSKKVSESPESIAIVLQAHIMRARHLPPGKEKNDAMNAVQKIYFHTLAMPTNSAVKNQVTSLLKQNGFSSALTEWSNDSFQLAYTEAAAMQEGLHRVCSSDAKTHCQKAIRLQDAQDKLTNLQEFAARHPKNIHIQSIVVEMTETVNRLKKPSNPLQVTTEQESLLSKILETSDTEKLSLIFEAIEKDGPSNLRAILYVMIAQDLKRQGNKENLRKFIKICSESRVNEKIYSGVSSNKPDTEEAKAFRALYVQYVLSLDDENATQYKIIQQEVASAISKKNLSTIETLLQPGVLDAKFSREILSQKKSRDWTFSAYMELRENLKSELKENKEKIITKELKEKLSKSTIPTIVEHQKKISATVGKINEIKDKKTINKEEVKQLNELIKQLDSEVKVLKRLAGTEYEAVTFSYEFCGISFKRTDILKIINDSPGFQEIKDEAQKILDQGISDISALQNSREIKEKCKEIHNAIDRIWPDVISQKELFPSTPTQSLTDKHNQLCLLLIGYAGDYAVSIEENDRSYIENLHRELRQASYPQAEALTEAYRSYLIRPKNKPAEALAVDAASQMSEVYTVLLEKIDEFNKLLVFITAIESSYPEKSDLFQQMKKEVSTLIENATALANAFESFETEKTINPTNKNISQMNLAELRQFQSTLVKPDDIILGDLKKRRLKLFRAHAEKQKSANAIITAIDPQAVKALLNSSVALQNQLQAFGTITISPASTDSLTTFSSQSKQTFGDMERISRTYISSLQNLMTFTMGLCFSEALVATPESEKNTRNILLECYKHQQAAVNT